MCYEDLQISVRSCCATTNCKLVTSAVSTKLEQDTKDRFHGRQQCIQGCSLFASKQCSWNPLRSLRVLLLQVHSIQVLGTNGFFDALATTLVPTFVFFLLLGDLLAGRHSSPVLETRIMAHHAWSSACGTRTLSQTTPVLTLP